MTVSEIIHRELSKRKFKWDGWDYQIYGPTSLDDEAHMIVKLYNENRSTIVLEIPLKMESKSK